MSHNSLMTLREGIITHTHPLLLWDLDTSGIFILI